MNNYAPELKSSEEIEKYIRERKPFRIHPTLKQLNLWGDNIGVEGAKALSTVLEKNTTLTALHLNCNIDDEGAKALSTVLEKNTTLTVLNLNGTYSCFIGAEGAKALSSALEKNTTLTTLNLHNNKIGVEGAKALSTALEKNTTLTKLVLDVNGIGAELREKINQQLHQNKTKAEQAKEYKEDEELTKKRALKKKTEQKTPCMIKILIQPPKEFCIKNEVFEVDVNSTSVEEFLDTVVSTLFPISHKQMKITGHFGLTYHDPDFGEDVTVRKFSILPADISKIKLKLEYEKLNVATDVIPTNFTSGGEAFIL